MTSFEEIISLFLFKIRDNEIPELDDDVFETKMIQIIKNAVGRIMQECETLYSKLKVDYEEKTFGELDDYEKKIIVDFMVLEYLKGFILDTDKLKQIMTDKAFSVFSQANKLSTLNEIYKDLENEALSGAYRYEIKNKRK